MFLLEASRLPEARRYALETSASPRLAQDRDTSQRLPHGTELEKVIEEGEVDEYCGFEDAGEVRDSRIDQGVGADDRVRRGLRSTYHRCWSNLNGLVAREVIALFRD